MGKWRFNRKEYDKHDKKSKQLAVEYLESEGFQLLKPLSEQGELLSKGDFEIIDPYGFPCIVEVEHKSMWEYKHGWEPRFPSLDIPYRKMKTFRNMIKDYEDRSLFIMFNNTYTTLAIISIGDILDSETYKKNTYGSTQEEFFMVDLNVVKIVVLGES